MHADAVVEALAALLLARREELGLSMAELATRAGITYQHISLIEKGRRCPTVDSLTRIAAGLETNGSELLRQAEENTGRSAP
jgi:transcriptional regulator with XRE-family HTH domain